MLSGEQINESGLTESGGREEGMERGRERARELEEGEKRGLWSSNPVPAKRLILLIL